MTEWKEYKLGEIAEITPGFAFKSKDFGREGELVVKIKDIAPPYIDLSNADHVDLSSYDKDKLCKYLLSEGDYVVAMTGATIGKVGKLNTSRYVYINQRVAKIKAKKGICDDFVYYSICGDDFQAFIQNNIDSNSAQENISANSIGRFPVLLPPLDEQRRIAAILSSLDDKIDLLHCENATLEQMAETLFKECISNKDNDGTIEQIISVQNGYAFKSKDFKETGEHKVIKIKNISGSIVDIDATDYVDNAVVLNISAKFKINSGDVLIAMTGAEIGKLGIIPQNDNNIWLNQRVGLLSEKFKGSKYLAYLQLKSDYGQDYIENTATGSAQPNISGSGIEKCGFPILRQENIIRISNQVGELYDKLVFNLGQINLLKDTRDFLLPKLMSNEIIII